MAIFEALIGQGPLEYRHGVGISSLSSKVSNNAHLEHLIVRNDEL